MWACCAPRQRSKGLPCGRLPLLFDPCLPCPLQFDDEFVKANFGSQLSSAEEMRKSLLASAAVDRVKDLDKQLEDALVEVGGPTETRGSRGEEGSATGGQDCMEW